MKILFISDTHFVDYDTWKGFYNISPDSFDIIAVLGDVEAIYLRKMREVFNNKRIVGVLGNHDKLGKFDYYDIENIHGKAIDVNGVKIAGIEGTLRYKNNDNFPLYSQFEIINICENLDKADVIISHNSPYGMHDSLHMDIDDICHLGFQGLLNYIENKKPKYAVHGHQHKDILTVYNGVNVLGLIGALILDLKSGELIKIF